MVIDYNDDYFSSSDDDTSEEQILCIKLRNTCGCKRLINFSNHRCVTQCSLFSNCNGTCNPLKNNRNRRLFPQFRFIRTPVNNRNLDI